MVALAQRFGEYNFGSLALAAYIKLHIHFCMPKFGKQSSFTKFYYLQYTVWHCSFVKSIWIHGLSKANVNTVFDSQILEAKQWSRSLRIGSNLLVSNLSIIIGTSFLLYLVGYIMLLFSGIWGVNVTSDWQRYITCRSIPLRTAMRPDYYGQWYWKLVPFLLFSTGKTIVHAFYFEFLVAQLPDKIKGLVSDYCWLSMVSWHVY